MTEFINFMIASLYTAQTNLDLISQANVTAPVLIRQIIIIIGHMQLHREACIAAYMHMKSRMCAEIAELNYALESSVLTEKQSMAVSAINGKRSHVEHLSQYYRDRINVVKNSVNLVDRGVALLG